MTIGKKIGAGFAGIIGLLIIVTGFSYFGILGIVDNATEVIEGNKLKGELKQKEVDHLNWANKVNQLLTDEKVTELKVETDHHKCAFGKWLYGEGRKQAEGLLNNNEFNNLLTSVEGPHKHLHESAKDISKVFVQADTALPGILAKQEVAHLKWASKIRTCFITNCDSLKVTTDPTKCGLGKWLNTEQAKNAYQNGSDNFKKSWEDLISTHKKLHESAIEINNTYKQVNLGLEELLLQIVIAHKNAAEKLSISVIKGQTCSVNTDPAKCAYGKFLSSKKYQEYKNNLPGMSAIINKSITFHNKFHSSVTKINSAIKANKKAEYIDIFHNQTLPVLEELNLCFKDLIALENVNRLNQEKAKDIFLSKTMPLLNHTLKDLDELMIASESSLEGMKKANNIFANKTIPDLQEVQKLLSKIGVNVNENIMTDKIMLDAANSTNIFVITFATIAIIAGIIAAIFIARGIISVLRIIINTLSSGSDQIKAASGEVSQSGQSLASGASEQAASLEEISASLEQISTQVKTNANNANEANTMSGNAAKAASEGLSAMTNMSSTINEIKSSSDKTAKIIKTIDEIAFQTNLLALNAAVEAARAGEAGKGFAVVAEEVRSLAQRSAQAAKDTSDLIEQSQINANNGVDASTKVNELIEQISESVEQVATLVGEVTVASGEQSEGINQINEAVAQLDQLTQTNAANAEESAASGEELDAQSNELKSVVQSLVAVIDGVKTNNSVQPQRVVARTASKPANSAKRIGSEENAASIDDNDFADF